MIREEYFRRLVDAAHVDIYLSANDGARIYWPWRMQPPKEASDTYRNACEVYVIDSDPQDDSVTNHDALDEAVERDAEVCSLQDVYLDFDGTVDALLDGLELADDHEFDGELLLPLQEPYAECWREIGEPTDHWIGIGGLKDGSDYARIEAMVELQREIPDDTHVHGFGWGVSDTLAATIRDDPSLLDTLDNSTAVQSNIDGVTSGDERMSVTAAFAGANLIQDLREVTDHPDEVDPPEQVMSGLADF